MERIRKYFDQHPLSTILIIGALIRLVSVLFSKGYGMHDDHFLVIETAQSWLDGADYYNWFREREFTDTPTILNFAMAGIHYLLFGFLEFIGIDGPQAKMYMVRLIHGAFSLLTIFYGYKIANKLWNREAAIATGLLLAFYWFMPFFSVRNLVEVVCIPFIMWGFWLFIKHDHKPGLRAALAAGILFGIAFSIRFQTLILPAGIGLVLLFRKQWGTILMMGLGIIIPFFALHGIPDWIIWGYPFAEVKAYILHNVEHRFDYAVSPWYLYLLLILGILIPPVSFFIVAGFIKSWRKWTILFVPLLLFIAFHSYFPNKQERFILPVLPLLITLGTVGWMYFLSYSDFWYRHRQLLRAFYIIFWIINIFLLSFFSTMYSKKARVESMTYLSKYDNVRSILIEDTNKEDATMLPLFYLGQWPDVYQVTKKYPEEALPGNVRRGGEAAPRFFLFFGTRQLHQRVLSVEELYPTMKFEKTIEPSLMDRVLHLMNPVNANETVYIYRNTRFYPHEK
jgi:hypothetical protein